MRPNGCGLPARSRVRGSGRPWPRVRTPRSRSNSCYAEDDAIHPIPAEVLQQQFQSVRGTPQVQVVTKARLRVHACHARLVGIDFPGMEVKNRRLLIAAIDVSDEPAREGVRHQAKVTAASRRPIGPKQADRGYGNLEDVGIDYVREP